jgi:hypothetical protein
MTAAYKMTALAPADLGKLAKVCGLFSSNHMGERAAAAAKADAIVRGAGLTWPDVLAPTLAAPRQSETSWRRELSPAVILATYGAALTGWEKNFLAGLVKHSNWTAKQREVLAGIQARFQ